MRSFHNCHSSPLQALKLCGGPAGSIHLSPLLLLQGHGQDHPVLGSPLKTRTNRPEATASSFVVASTSSPMSPDAPVLLQTGGLLVFTFWFFNFFMTDQISKLYGFDKVDEEEEEEDEDEDSADGSPSEVQEPNMPPSVASSQATSATKKQGFGNNKPKTKTKRKTKTKS